MKLPMWAGVLLAVSLQTQAANPVWIRAKAKSPTSRDLAGSLQRAFQTRGVRPSEGDAPTPPPACQEFPTLRMARGKVTIVKSEIEKVGDKYSHKETPVCTKDLDVRVLDLRQEGNCYRSDWVVCDTEIDGKKMRVGVSAVVNVETMPYPEVDSPARDVKLMGSGLFVLNDDDSFSEFQQWEGGAFSTSDISLADATLHMVPPSMQCASMAQPDGSVEYGCKYRPVTYQAKLHVQDAP